MASSPTFVFVWWWKSQRHVHSSSCRLGSEHGLAQPQLLPHLIYHTVEQKMLFLTKQCKKMDSCCIKGFLEWFSCLLTFTIQLKRCEEHFLKVLH